MILLLMLIVAEFMLMYSLTIACHLVPVLSTYVRFESCSWPMCCHLTWIIRIIISIFLLVGIFAISMQLVRFLVTLWPQTVTCSVTKWLPEFPTRDMPAMRPSLHLSSQSGSQPASQPDGQTARHNVALRVDQSMPPVLLAVARLCVLP